MSKRPSSDTSRANKKLKKVPEKEKYKNFFLEVRNFHKKRYGKCVRWTEQDENKFIKRWCDDDKVPFLEFFDHLAMSVTGYSSAEMNPFSAISWRNLEVY